ncbi:MAG: NifU family protein [Actinomycetota bacterium]
MTIAERTGEATPGADLRAAGDRIERLLEASSTSGPVARERAEELVRTVVELYGTGLEHVMELLYDAGALSDEVLDRLTSDDLVSGLLLVHDLHPYGVQERVQRALDAVRPYLGSHGGDVELVGVAADEAGGAVVHLRMLGSCDGCPSSSVTLSLAVDDAIKSAAPEVVAIEVEESPAAAKKPALIPADSLTARLREQSGGATWLPVIVPEAPGVTAIVAGGLDLVLCRVGDAVYAFLDRCGVCDSGLSTAALERPLGSPLGAAVLTCPACHAHFEVHRAGAGSAGTEGRLDPLPLLERDGAIEVAVPRVVPA